MEKKPILNKRPQSQSAKDGDMEEEEETLDIPFHSLFLGDPEKGKIPLALQQCGRRVTKEGITIYQFDHEQTKKTFSVNIDLPGIHDHPKELINVEFKPLSLRLEVYRLGKINYQFGIKHLSHEIIPCECYFTVKEDCVILTLIKCESILWDSVYYCHPSVEEKWLIEFSPFLQATLPYREMILSNIWTAAQVLCESEQDWVNPGFPFRSMIPPSVKSLDDVINHLKKSIKPETDGSMKYFYLGAVILHSLQQTHNDEQIAADKENAFRNKIKAKSSGTKENCNKPNKHQGVTAKKKRDTPVSDADAKRLEGNEFFKANNYQKAMQCYTEAINMKPTTALYYTNRAASYSKLNLHQECFADAYQASNLDPSSVKAWYYMGKSATLVGLPDLSVKYLVKAKALNPLCNETDAELRKANKMLLLSDEYLEAMRKKEIKKAVKLLDDINGICNIMGGSLRMKLYEYLIADRQYERVMTYASIDLVNDPKDYQAYYFLGKCNFYLGTKEIALEFLEESLKTSFYSHLQSQPFGSESIKPQTDKLSQKIVDFFSFREKGDTAFKKNKLSEALKWYLKSVKVDPSNKVQNACLYCKIGNIKMKEFDYKEAVKYFTLSIDNDTDFLEPLFRRSSCYEHLKQCKNSIVDYQTICEIDPSEEHITGLKALEMKLKDGPTLGKNVPLSLAERKKLAKEKETEGNKQQKSDQFRSAVNCYTESLLWDPNCDIILLKRSVCYMKLKSYGLSHEDAKAALAIEPLNIEASLQVARTSLLLGRGEEALEVLKKARKLDAGNRDVLRESNNAQKLAGLVLNADRAMKDKNYKVASVILKDVVEIAKGSVPLSFKLAECLIYDQSIDDADYIASTIMLAKNYHPEQECIFGLCKFYEGNLEASIKHFKRALEISPNHAKSLDILSKVEQVSKFKKEGNDAFKLLNWSSALSCYHNGLKVDPLNNFMNSVFNFNVGMVHLKQENVSDAIEEFSSAISLREDYLKALLKRAECYLKLGNQEKASEDYKLVIKINPKEKHEKLHQLLQRS